MLFAKIKALSTRAVRGTYKERDTFCGHNMYTCAAYWIHWQFQVVHSIMERYALSNIQVKALPWLVLYGKYGTQRVAFRQNIALGFASCYIYIYIYIYLSLAHSFMCDVFHIALTAML